MGAVGEHRIERLEAFVDNYYRVLDAIQGTSCHLFIARDYLAWGTIDRSESSVGDIEFDDVDHARLSRTNLLRAVSELFCVDNAVKVHSSLSKREVYCILDNHLEHIAEYNKKHGVLVRTIGRPHYELVYEKDGESRSHIDEEAARAVSFGEIGKIPIAELYMHFKPKMIIAELDSYVIGQVKAKRALARAVYWHLQRIHDIETHGSTPMQNQSVLLLGPSGSGKTLLCETLGEIIGLPFVKRDATALTAAGYVGEGINDYMREMWEITGGNLKRLRYGIFLIDEIDKLANQSGSGEDVNGKGAQQRLLRFSEGTKVFMNLDSGKSYPGPEYLDSSYNMKIFAGSFLGKGQPGIEHIIKKRVHPTALGFGHVPIQPQYLLDHVVDEDLLQFGILRELAARMTIKAPLSRQTLDDLCCILTVPKGSIIEQYKKAFQIDGHTLTFDDDALRAIAEAALAQGSNARSLRPIIDLVLGPIQEELAGKEKTQVHITKDDVMNALAQAPTKHERA